MSILRRNLAALLLAATLPGVAAAADPYRGEILWDRYGVPHIYAADEASLFYGFGWAQARNHADLILRLFAESRGRAAEYFGPERLESDRWVRTNNVPARAAAWYAAQTPAFRANLDAFAAGVNAYAAANPDKIDDAAERVLPLTGVDLVAHAHKLVNFSYVVSPGRVTGEGGGITSGSNAWAVAPKRSASGGAMLLHNPHLSWVEGQLTYMEAHLNAPGIQMYGATQIALPVLRFMFNERMGFTNTVNNMLGATTYRLTPADGGYLFDGAARPFTVRSETIRVRQPDGTLREEPLEIRESVHGPVFTRRDGTLVALRVAGLDKPAFLEQYWNMGKARDFDAFLGEMRRLQIPTFNIVYADRAGRIGYFFNGAMPKRGSGDLAFWQGLVPGDTSATLWTDIHPFAELPQVIDPPAGFVQNANDPPWLATWPQTIRSGDYPAYAAPAGPFSLRAQQSVLSLQGEYKLSFEAFVAGKMSTHALMAQRVLPDLLPAAAASDDPLIRQAGSVLAAWNRWYDKEAKGALLFEAFARRFAGPQFNQDQRYARRFTMDDPLATPVGLADPAEALRMLKEAAEETIQRYGAIDRPFGAVSRFRLRDVDVPGHGAFGNLGILRVMTWNAPQNGARTPNHGETWVSMIEFAPEGTRALGLMSYGNATQPGSPHKTDQLQMLSDSALRPLPLKRAEVRRQAVERERF